MLDESLKTRSRIDLSEAFRVEKRILFAMPEQRIHLQKIQEEQRKNAYYKLVRRDATRLQLSESFLIIAGVLYK